MRFLLSQDIPVIIMQKNNNNKNRKRQYIESYFSCHCFAKSQQKACII